MRKILVLPLGLLMLVGVLFQARQISAVLYRANLAWSPTSFLAGPAAPNSPAQTRSAGSEPFEFMQTYTVPGGNAPVRWPSCTSLTLLVETIGMPATGAADVQSAAQQLAQATGLKVEVAMTGLVPLVNPDGVIPIRWKSSDSNFCNSGDAVACTQIHYAPMRSKPITRIIDAEVVLYTDHAGPYLRRTLLHELGHAVGLNHVTSQNEIMFERVTDVNNYRLGDLAGLHIAGQGAC